MPINGLASADPARIKGFLACSQACKAPRERQLSPDGSGVFCGNIRFGRWPIFPALPQTPGAYPLGVIRFGVCAGPWSLTTAERPSNPCPLGIKTAVVPPIQTPRITQRRTNPIHAGGPIRPAPHQHFPKGGCARLPGWHQDAQPRNATDRTVSGTSVQHGPVLSMTGTWR